MPSGRSAVILLIRAYPVTTAVIVLTLVTAWVVAVIW